MGKKYQLPVGTGSIKKSKDYNKLKPLQKEVYNQVYDPINGILFFAENCAYTNRNGIEQYVPFDYQREMLFNMLHYKNVISLFSRQNGKCFLGTSKIKIRNKINGLEKEITIEEFFNKIKNK